MATTKIVMNETLRKAQQVRSWLAALEQVLDAGDDLFRDFPTMIDGDGSSSTQFALVTQLLGTTNDAMSKSLWDEFQSAWGKLSGDGTVSVVNTALRQIIAKCR